MTVNVLYHRAQESSLLNLFSSAPGIKISKLECSSQHASITFPRKTVNYLSVVVLLRRALDFTLKY